MKYWNKKRLRHVKERRDRSEKLAFTRYVEEETLKRTHAKGSLRKNARLMLEALGDPLHRRMLTRLRKGGAMSVSHVAKPFRVLLPNAMRHVHILERAGLITTEKRGRIRFCVYNPKAPKELANWLSTRQPFDVD